MIPKLRGSDLSNLEMPESVAKYIPGKPEIHKIR